MSNPVPVLELISRLTFEGVLHGEEDLSAIAVVKDALIIGADEGHQVQLLKKSGTDTYAVDHNLILKKDPPDQEKKTETDIEDICCEGTLCYVIGSHSRKRKTTKDKHDQNKNRKRLYKSPEREQERETLYRVRLKDGALVKEEETSLYGILKDDKLLEPFLAIPSKENGIDIEGIAIARNKLYVGFRSPVLRENYVPILELNTKDLNDEPKIKFIQMGGRGIRAMTETEDGILILGGPPGDGDMSYQLYFWNEKDMVTDEKKDLSDHLILLGTVPTYGLKAEGLAILSTQENFWEIIVVYDGIKGGAPSILRVNRP